jgi:hypothetical protein
MLARDFEFPLKIAARCSCGGRLRDIYFGTFIAECTCCGRKFDPLGLPNRHA